jgi:cation diffusion facilitator CzcD-associated flavoprotein CzcO
MQPLDYSDKYCVVGAGSSGLTAAKNLDQLGIACDVIEREDDVGGNWYYGRPHSSVYKSTHLISSKPGTEYVDFPMPADYPDYPSHWQVFEYFKSYARAFDLYRLIQFNTSVERIERAGELWDIRLDNGETRRYGGLIIANGHNWDPKYPQYPGEFHGLCLHSADYKTSDVLVDRRVLVVGAGNSGCDIAVESAQNARATFHSTRRGYYYAPKFVLGMPSDQIAERGLRLRIPLALRRAFNVMLIKVILGDPTKYGLPKPDHKFYETHPIVNSQMLYYVGHGEIKPKPDVQELRGDRVLFSDGSEEPIDVLIYATGFKITFPFIDQSYLNWHDNKPNLYMNVFHPQYDNFFVAGLIQPDSGQWGLVDYQAQLIARFVHSQRHDPARAAAFRRTKTGAQPRLNHGINYVNSTRHYLEVEHFTYRNGLKKLIRQFG